MTNYSKQPMLALWLFTQVEDRIKNNTDIFSISIRQSPTAVEALKMIADQANDPMSAPPIVAMFGYELTNKIVDYVASIQ